MTEVEDLAVKFIRRTFNFAVGHSPACSRYFAGSRRTNFAQFIVGDVLIERSREEELSSENKGTWSVRSLVKSYTCEFIITSPDFQVLTTVRYTRTLYPENLQFSVSDFIVDEIIFDGNEQVALDWFPYAILMDQGA